MARLFVLTGAGISAESGLATFRAADGLWENHRIDEVATPEAFRRNPDLVQRFYNERRAALRSVEPNAAHLALAKLQLARPDEVTLVTQNVDDLHDRAGSRVIHMHGELLKARCTRCGEVLPWDGPLGRDNRCPLCLNTGTLRPHIVWFGEVPLDMEEIEEAALRCDVFTAIGTSGGVYPAAGLSSLAKMHGARCLEFNLANTTASPRFDEHRTGPASQTVPLWVEECLRNP